MKNCIHCGHEIDDIASTCIVCGHSLLKKACPQCNTGSYSRFIRVHEQELCLQCAKNYIENGIKDMAVYNALSVNDYRIVANESVKLVIGTGIEKKSTEFEMKLVAAKEIALKELKCLAFVKGANAVIEISMDYAEFTGNRLGLIANGTLVSVVPKENKILEDFRTS